MARVIFTPWKTQDQLVAVRDQFYPPPTYDGPDLREHACAQVCTLYIPWQETNDTC